MALPLEGFRIIEWTQWQAGPMAGVLLADLGAEVIKIEHREQGDAARGFQQSSGVSFISGRNAYYEGCNRGKKGITLDLTKAKGKQILYELVQRADAFLHNYRHSVAVKLGVDYETLVKYNPKLVYSRSSGFGDRGPDRDQQSFDYTGLARSGIMTCVGEPNDPPMRIAGAIGDQMAGTMAAFGMVVALLTRERTGVGQEVDSSLLGSMLWLQGVNVNWKLIGGQAMERARRTEVPQPLWNHYRCGDGEWVALAHLQAQRYWPNVCRALGLEDIQHDSRFVETEDRRTHNVELIAILDQAFARKSRSEWLPILRENGVIHTPVSSFDDLENDPQIAANEYISAFNHPVWGPIKWIGMPFHFSKTPGEIRAAAPEFGEHTEIVLTGILGYSWDEVAKLGEEEVI